MVIVAPAAMGEPALALEGVNVAHVAREMPGAASMTHNSRNTIQRPHTLRPSP
ncbi:hypothetical protein [Dyella sp. EPa41]|uniref:hypothetical protein n=1 Tax=Dyella sp. EPa41 TaxID=1561194 RepID=UPI001F3AD79C|nr:hypothetical protein [Dyella sp. EPa41]